MTGRGHGEVKIARPSWLRGRLAKWSLLAYRFGLGALVARWVMVLTTKGRVTGRARRTPLWYVREADIVYCVSGWGPISDWSKNLKADPHAVIKIGRKTWNTRAELNGDRQERAKVLDMIQRKYGLLSGFFYHDNQLSTVAFQLN